MKRKILTIAFTAFMLLGALCVTEAQDQPAPKKDTVNMDTDAKPTFYYAVEDEAGVQKSGSATTIVIAGVAVLLAGVVGFFLLKKKK